MPVDGGPKKNEASASSVLRAAAPVFVPSSGVAVVPSATVGSISPPEVVARNYRNRNRNSDRKPGNEQTKKKKPQRQRRGRRQRRQEIDELSKSDATLPNRHTDANGSNESTNNRKNSVKSQAQARRSNTKARGRRRHRNRNPEPKSKKTDGQSDATRTRMGYNKNYETDVDDDSDNAITSNIALASPLAFPALMDHPSSSSDRLKLPPTIWSGVTVVRELLEGQLQRDLENEKKLLQKQEAEKWQNGLDRLTSQDKKVKPNHARQEFLSWDENDQSAEKDSDGGNRETDGSAVAQLVSHTTVGGSMTLNSDKRTFNINRLRDRWWAALAEQQRRLQQQREELEQQRQADSNHEIYLDQDDHIETYYGESKQHDSSHDGKDDLSDLQRKVNEIVSLCQEEGRKIKLLDRIIEQNDDQALRDMIELAWNTESENDRKAEDLVEYAITVLIRRNHPNLLRTILSITRGKVPINSKPLLQAAMLGHEECASILLSKQEKGSTMLFLDDVDGNTALHYCCRENGNKDMLRTLLKQVIGNTKRERQELLKLVTIRNKSMQTALHVACESGRTDLVEVFLATCKTSVLFKLLSIEDNKLETPLLCAVSNNSCDVVLSLLMWRRNHEHQHQKQPETRSRTRILYTNDIYQNQTNKPKTTACPLFWAAKSGNIEMIDLLIQFGDQSGASYQATDALLTLLRADVPDETKLEGSNSLILAGGNPFQEFASQADNEKETSINVATKVASADVLRSIISTALQLLEKRQLDRRRDPVLQQQPEAFFKTLECKENSEVEKAISDALIESLVRVHSNSKHSDFSKAIVLYEKIGKLRDEYILRLQNGLRTGKLTLSANASRNWCFLAVYRHFTNVVTGEKSNPKSLDFDRSVFEDTSLGLLKLPWITDELSNAEFFCPWMRRTSTEVHIPLHDASDDLLTLVADDGSRFLVHATIVSEKSEKIASALRFARMKCNGGSFEETISLEVNIAPDFCKLMIQHMYHGSICFGWPNLDDTEMCRYLLEMMIMAEEFLIPSLVQEVEMRLLSSTPTKCFCWDCCQACRYSLSDDGKIEAECLFMVEGSSNLINKDTAMDVLSLTDYIDGLDYKVCMAQISSEICIKTEKIWESYDGEINDQKSLNFQNALSFLRNAAILKILKEFAHVVGSPDFYLTTEGDQREELQTHILLKICLDELRNNSVVTMTPDKSVSWISADRKD